MNEFVLKEKHKYWDNKITLEKYIKDVEESGYIDCTSDYEYEYWYILENLKKLNNLQSKIYKANEILNRPQFEYDNIPCNYEEDIKELRDVLKEVE